MSHPLSRPPTQNYERAECYGLISDSFAGRADARVLSQLAAQALPEEEAREWQLLSLEHEPKPNAYTIAFRALQQVCSQCHEDAINEEHQALFPPNARVLGSTTACEPGNSSFARHVTALRSYLAASGLSRARSSMRMENHVSAVCDVMRRLVIAKRPIEDQLSFFNEFVLHSVPTFCAAVETHRATYFFRAVAVFARAFIQQEVLNLERAQLERCPL